MNDDHRMQRRAVFSGTFLALIAFFVVVPLASIFTCVALRHVATEDEDNGKNKRVATVADARQDAAQKPAPAFVWMAMFDKNGDLNVCFTTNISLSDGSTEIDPEKLNHVDALLARDAGRTQYTELDHDCESSFGDRLVLAKCDLGSNRGSVQYYNFGALGTDREMRDCLKTKGTWSSLSRESDEYQEAKMRYDAEQAQRELRKLERQ